MNVTLLIDLKEQEFIMVTSPDLFFIMISRHDIIIIGGGPIGLACGIEAKKKGYNYIIIEKGCIVNSLYNYPLNMTFFSTSERLEIDGIPFVSVNAKPTRPEALEYYRRVAYSSHLNIHLQEECLEVSQCIGSFAVRTSKASYQATYIIIATGFYDRPVMLDVPGEALPKVTHYYRDPHFYAMQKVIVVGANNSAVDAALETHRKGAEVTMIIKGAEIGARVKYWAKPDIENRIKEGSIKAYFQSSVKSISEHEVMFETPETRHSIANDFVILMTGYQPQFDFLVGAGIILSNDASKQPVYNPQNMETNVPNIFLAGVVCGGMNTHSWFIENSREHAARIIGHISRVS